MVCSRFPKIKRAPQSRMPEKLRKIQAIVPACSPRRLVARIPSCFLHLTSSIKMSWHHLPNSTDRNQLAETAWIWTPVQIQAAFDLNTTLQCQSSWRCLCIRNIYIVLFVCQSMQVQEVDFNNCSLMCWFCFDVAELFC